MTGQHDNKLALTHNTVSVICLSQYLQNFILIRNQTILS